MTKPERIYRPRLIQRKEDEPLQVVSIGKRREWLGDAYVRLLASSWRRLSVIISLSYLCINFFFATLYYIGGSSIENARPGVFIDVFFFSVQTLATIGYGKMSPIGIYSNLLVTLEAFMGFAFYAMITGLVFSKFSSPTARVLFSNIAVICPYEGTPHLMIRMANERRNRIVDARAQLVVLRDEVSQEGVRMRRFVDLLPVRSQVPVLQLTWTLMHRIDETSPLYGLATEQLCTTKAELIVSLTGLDETLSQTIHTRYSYLAEEVLFNNAFEDILERKADKLYVDYTKFHLTKQAVPAIEVKPL